MPGGHARAGPRGAADEPVVHALFELLSWGVVVDRLKAARIARLLDLAERADVHDRLLAPIGYVPPAEHEAAYYRGQSAAAELVTLT